MKTFMGMQIKFCPSIPDGMVILSGYRPSGPGTADPMEQYGSVLRPDGTIVEYIVRDGRVQTR